MLLNELLQKSPVCYSSRGEEEGIKIIVLGTFCSSELGIFSLICVPSARRRSRRCMLNSAGNICMHLNHLQHLLVQL